MGHEQQERARVLYVFNNILTNSTEPAEAVTSAPTVSSDLPSKRWLYWQMVRAVSKKVMRAPFSIHTWGALRRTILSNFLPDSMVYRYKAYQRGECNRCGLCCRIQFQCPFLVDKGPYNTHCSIYTTPHAPSACLRFPVDPLDLKLLQREIGNACTFYFEGAPQKLSILEFARLYASGMRQQFAKKKLREATDSPES